MFSLLLGILPLVSAAQNDIQAVTAKSGVVNSRIEVEDIRSLYPGNKIGQLTQDRTVWKYTQLDFTRFYWNNCLCTLRVTLNRGEILKLELFTEKKRWRKLLNQQTMDHLGFQDNPTPTGKDSHRYTWEFSDQFSEFRATLDETWTRTTLTILPQ